MDDATTRFRDAVDRSRLSLHALHQHLKGQGVTGSSYASLHRYYSGEIGPRLDILLAAAPVLDVSPKWLAYGEGEATETDAASRRVRGAVDARAGEDYPVAARADEIPIIDLLPPHARSVFWHVLERYAAGSPDTLGEDEVLALGVSLARFLVVPYWVWGFRHDLMGTPEAFGTYAVAMLHALVLALPPAGHGDEYDERGVWHADHISFHFADDAEERKAATLKRRRAEVAEMDKGLRVSLERIRWQLREAGMDRDRIDATLHEWFGDSIREER